MEGEPLGEPLCAPHFPVDGRLKEIRSPVLLYTGHIVLIGQVMMACYRKIRT
jgi:hypothetical protein